MPERVSVERRGEVAVIAIVAGGAGPLGRALLAACDAVEADPGLRAVVLTGLAAAADAEEDGGNDAGAAPALADAAARLEALSRPVIACLEGAVLGPAFELALAAHWRLAASGASLGFPGIALGRMPEAGGTQRLARLAGARVALELSLSGRPIGAEAAEAAGLVDGVLLGDLAEAGVRLAGNLAEKGIGLRPTIARRDGFADPAGYLADVATRRRSGPSRNPAEARLIDCVEAALLLPGDEGLSFERTAAADCRATPEARALGHAAAAERRAAQFPEAGRAPARAGLIDAGAAGGSGLAVALLDAGLPVVVFEHDAGARDAASARIEAAYEAAVEARRLTPEEAVARLSAAQVTTDPAALSACDVVLDVPGDVPLLRRQMLARAAPALARGAVLATLDPDLTPGADGAPPHLPGLHFLGPLRAARVVEVVVGSDTPPEAVAAAFDLVRRLGRIAVRAGAVEGLIGDRVYAACLMAADRLLAEGAGVEEVDEAMRAAGFALGPYQMTDLSGLEGGWSGLARRRAARAPDLARLDLADRLVEGGRLGRRVGRGYYRYAEGGGRGQSDPVVAMLLAEERAKRSTAPRRIGAAEIRHRLLAAMANEGARLLGEGVALRPSDVDVVMLHGFGFPRWLGGPMQWADETGLIRLRADLKRWSEADRFWDPAPLWQDLVKNGRSLADLNAAAR